MLSLDKLAINYIYHNQFLVHSKNWIQKVTHGYFSIIRSLFKSPVETSSTRSYLNLNGLESALLWQFHGHNVFLGPTVTCPGLALQVHGLHQRSNTYTRYDSSVKRVTIS